MRLFEEIKSDGVNRIRQFVENNEQETQILEFKSSFEIKNGKFTKQGAQAISKHFTGMANGAGGVIVVGIQTKSDKNTGIDYAMEITPIPSVKIYAEKIAGAVSLYSSEPIQDLDWIAIEIEEKTGVICFLVPKSEHRPHMATATGLHKYFRRGLDRTSIMDHLQVKEMMFAKTQAFLLPETGFRRQQVSGGKFKFGVEYKVKNTSNLIAKNCFLTVISENHLRGSRSPSFNHRANDDQITYFLSKNQSIVPNETALFALPEIEIQVEAEKVKNDLSDGYESPWILPKNWKLTQGHSQIKLICGAENASINQAELTTSIDMIFDQEDIREYISTWGLHAFSKYLDN